MQAYQDSVGIWTIGYGHTGPDVFEGVTISQEQADRLLAVDLERFARTVEFAVTVPVGQHEFDALVSLTFNIGGGAFRKSTLLKKLNAGDRAGAAAQFARWNKAGGKTLAGLTRRRAAEAKLFLGASEI